MISALVALPLDSAERESKNPKQILNSCKVENAAILVYVAQI